VEAAEKQLTLGELQIGSRLVLRCRKDWREAVVSHFREDKAVLSVASDSGKTYRVRRKTDLPLILEGKIPILTEDCEELEWRENLIKYDSRW
jgi:hypothetical protein